MKRVYLVRHGQTDWNLQGRTQGSKDSNLTALGLRQVESLGQYFKNIDLDEIYSSPLKRAYSTAKFIGNMKNLTCNLDSRLEEMNFGKWEGMTHREIQDTYPKISEIWRRQPHLAVIPEAETMEKAQKRIVEFIDDKIIPSKENTILLVSHGIIIRLLLLKMLSMDLKHYYKLRQNNCSINLIELNEGQASLVKYNDTCHIEGL